MTHEQALYPEQNNLIYKQIRAGALLTSNLQEKERDQALKQNKKKNMMYLLLII